MVKMKALVVFGTRYGSTEEVAKEIGKALDSSGIQATLVDAKGAGSDLAGFDLVVIGSGIRAGAWVKEAKAFLKRNQQQLATKKVALFVSCGFATAPPAKREKAKEMYLDRIASQFSLAPVSMGFFGGCIKFNEDHGFMHKMVARSAKKEAKRGSMDICDRLDKRDWEQVRAWTRDLAMKVK